MYLDLFPTLVLQKILSNSLVSQIESFKNHIISLPVYGEDENGVCTIEQQLLNNSLFTELSQEILNSSKEYLNEIGHIFKDIQISSSWAPRFNKGVPSLNHNHANSYLSGVYYLTEGSPIELLSPLTSLWNFQAALDSSKTNPRFKESISINPVPNGLLIFPSFLYHFVHPPKEDGRISIAFNIIPKGEFGHLTRKLYL